MKKVVTVILVIAMLLTAACAKGGEKESETIPSVQDTPLLEIYLNFMAAAVSKDSYLFNYHRIIEDFEIEGAEFIKPDPVKDVFIYDSDIKIGKLYAGVSCLVIDNARMLILIFEDVSNTRYSIDGIYDEVCDMCASQLSAHWDDTLKIAETKIAGNEYKLTVDKHEDMVSVIMSSPPYSIPPA